jgi:hypothetical protein
VLPGRPSIYPTGHLRAGRPSLAGPPIAWGAATERAAGDRGASARFRADARHGDRQPEFASVPSPPCAPLPGRDGAPRRRFSARGLWLTAPRFVGPSSWALTQPFRAPVNFEAAQRRSTSPFPRLESRPRLLGVACGRSPRRGAGGPTPRDAFGQHRRALAVGFTRQVPRGTSPRTGAASGRDGPSDCDLNIGMARNGQ